MNKKNKIVIFCESYPSIAYTLYRIANEDRETPVTIFFPVLHDLYRLFLDINEKVFNNNLELIYFPAQNSKSSNRKGIKKLLLVFYDILLERRHLSQFYRKHFASLEGVEILFPSPAFSGVKIYMLTRMSKRNKLIFIDPGSPFYFGRYTPSSIREIATLLVYKMKYGKDVQLGQFPSVNSWKKGFPLFSEKFMKKWVSGRIDWSNREEIMESFDWEKFRVFNTGDHKVIYFHHTRNWVDQLALDRETFRREIISIFDIVLRYFPEKEIAHKYHPGKEHSKDFIGVGEGLPIYIPAELLYDKKVKIYLGITSTAIKSVRGGQAISIIELISFKSGINTERLKEMALKNSNSEILFPSSFEELEKIISNASGKTL